MLEYKWTKQKIGPIENRYKHTKDHIQYISFSSDKEK